MNSNLNSDTTEMAGAAVVAGTGCGCMVLTWILSFVITFVILGIGLGLTWFVFNWMTGS